LDPCFTNGIEEKSASPFLLPIVTFKAVLKPEGAISQPHGVSINDKSRQSTNSYAAIPQEL
jgi:hypothetical protein